MSLREVKQRSKPKQQTIALVEQNKSHVHTAGAGDLPDKEYRHNTGTVFIWANLFKKCRR